MKLTYVHFDPEHSPNKMLIRLSNEYGMKEFPQSGFFPQPALESNR